MRTIQTNIYSFDELNEDAKAKAIEWYRILTLEDGYNWSEEAIESLREMAKHFDGKLEDYSIDFFDGSYSSARFDMPGDEDIEAKDIKEKLNKLGSYNPITLKGNGDCALTGVCFDESVIDGFRQAWHKGERDLNKLMQAGFHTWLEDCQSDAKSQLEDEYIIDAIQSNEYEFTEDGKRYIS